MYAIIETGGKQYRVQRGDTVDVELLDGDVGDTVELDQVLMVAGDGEMVVGTPTVEDAVVKATVLDEVRGDKVVVFKYKPGNRYRRKTGHRQNYTRLQIEEIIAPGVDIAEPEEEIVEPVEEVDEAPVEAPAAELTETTETAAPVETEVVEESEPDTVMAEEAVETEAEEPAPDTEATEEAEGDEEAPAEVDVEEPEAEDSEEE